MVAIVENVDTVTNVIETISLAKEFRDFWGRVRVKALDSLDIQVHSGEIFGLLGPNGSGKTTTIKLLLGLLFPTRGKIRVLGKSPQNVDIKHRIGFLPEETYLYPYQNAEESLYFYGRLFGLSSHVCSKRVNDLLDMVGLSKARKRSLKEYSKGMARRIGVAQALINDPELIFLDEPTTGLDPLGTKEIKDLIVHLKKCGKTIVLSSHLLADVEDICDRVAILYGGKIQVYGTITELLTEPNVEQICLDNLSVDDKQTLQNFLEQKNIRHQWEHPRQSLEKFFLQVIQNARYQQVPTSGAEAGKIVANFFKKPEDVISELLPTCPSPEAIITPLHDTPSTSSSNSVLESLLQPQVSENVSKQASPTVGNEKKILDDLLPK